MRRALQRSWPAIMVAPLAAWLFLPAAGSPPACLAGNGVGAGAPPTVVYVGADDCAPCRRFNEERWPAIRRSARNIDLREVRSPTFRDVLDDEYWAADLRPYRNAIPPEAGVPLWVVVCNNSVVKVAWGVRQWDDQVMPLLYGAIAR